MIDLFGKDEDKTKNGANPASAGTELPMDELGRPTVFPMAIQGGMLEALGINMYTTIGKCLVEFVANAHDSDATKVEIDIPYARIATERERIREAAKKRVEVQQADPFTVLLETLPSDIEIVITDDGHGMSPEDVYTKFMPLNRKRRVDQHGKETVNLTESGNRNVMGRKGLGKLAGFGAAAEISITTKRKNDTYSTTFVMNYDDLKDSENLANVKIPASYTPDQPPEKTGTTIRLRRLKCDAVKQSGNTIEEAIATAFYGIEPEDFSIIVNDTLLAAPEALYEYEYPVDGRNEDGFAEEVLNLDEGMIELPFQYVVKFRARIADPERPHLKTGSLSSEKRGARIYCNRRLAAGPTTKGLPSGMHNFYASEYMECYVKADELDRASVDFVNTNRTELREDNEVVQKLMERIIKIMGDAVRAHGYWREGLVDKKVNDKVKSDRRLSWVATLPKKQREAAKNVLKAIAVTHDVDSEEFQEIAPHMMQAMNASDVLAKLIHLRTDPESITKIARHLEEWQGVERQDVVKHYRARRNAIGGLAKLVEDGEKSGKTGPRNEKALHFLLKDNPWLVRPEYAQYVASDVHMTTTLSKIANHLEIDDFARPHVPEGNADTTRPDLVFALGNQPNKVYEVIVVELKSTTLDLTFDHWRQLNNYVGQTEEWLQKNFPLRQVEVRGMLVGKMPDHDTQITPERELIRWMRDNMGRSKIEVIGLQDMLERSRVVHAELIDLLENEDDEELIDGPVAPPAANQAAAE